MKYGRLDFRRRKPGKARNATPEELEGKPVTHLPPGYAWGIEPPQSFWSSDLPTE